MELVEMLAEESSSLVPTKSPIIKPEASIPQAEWEEPEEPELLVDQEAVAVWVAVADKVAH
jgi:hypothetical protein